MYLGESAEVEAFWRLDSCLRRNDKDGVLAGRETLRLRTQGGSYFGIRILSSLFGIWFLDFGIYYDGFLPAQVRPVSSSPGLEGED
jgi:hypothetical protein